MFFVEVKCIQYKTGVVPSSVFCVPSSVFRHKFCIQLALPISPIIMDRFLCFRCLYDHIEVPDMMRLFAAGATPFW